jgi:hypothetical protein
MENDHFFLVSDMPIFSVDTYDYIGQDTGGYVYGLLSLADLPQNQLYSTKQLQPKSS